MLGTTTLYFVGNERRQPEHVEWIQSVSLCEAEPTFDKNWLFENTVEVGGWGCWLWNGRLTERGTPIVRDNGRSYQVHRLVWEMFFGGSARHGKITQHCGQAGCVNPQHYSIGGEENG